MSQIQTDEATPSQGRGHDERRSRDSCPPDLWGDRLPAFAQQISWLRWLSPLSAEWRLTIGFGTLALLTSPLFVFLVRQAVPDPIFVGLLNGAMACLMIVLLDDDAPHEGWAAAFYCLVGLATLSKGLLGFAIPGAVALLYFVVT